MVKFCFSMNSSVRMPDIIRFSLQTISAGSNFVISSSSDLGVTNSVTRNSPVDTSTRAMP